MLHLLDQLSEPLRAWLAERKLPAYRAAQIQRWLFEKRAGSFDEMTDLPGTLRDQLSATFQVWTTAIAAHRQADDGTEKLLLELHDAQRIECVLLRDDRQHCAMCLSSQVGCGMGCVFCASGLDGVVRNLTTGEIVEQMLQLGRLLQPSERLSHIVVMGMGEPLANLDHLLPALALATADDGLGISVRRVTISTVGLPAGIRRLADEDCQYHLAVSLHAAEDSLRDRLVPANRKIGIAAVLAAADDYFARTGRRVTYEYALLGGVNDRAADARQLIALLRGRPALINLIPYNPVAGLPYRGPSRVAVTRFAQALTQGGLTIHVRRRKGDAIDAACGQLRRGRGEGEGIGD
jgi:23S rRNA (adenine2503-C2)-methyltransferase